MALFPWRRKRAEPDSPRVAYARAALAVSHQQLVQAKQLRVVSEHRRMTLAEIRRANHFTPSIFPEGK